MSSTTYIATLLSLILLFSCTERSPSTPSPTQPNVETESYGPFTVVTPDGRCTTERQVFFADTSDEARRQMCEALIDHEKNFHCAEDRRRQEFFSRCEGVVGLAWTPDRTSQDSLATANTGPVGRLKNLYISEFRVHYRQLSPSVQRHLDAMLSEFQECGHAYNGSYCKNSQVEIRVVTPEQIQKVDGQDSLLIRVSQVGTDSNYIFQYILGPNSTLFQPQSLKVFLLDEQRPNTSTENLIADEGEVHLVYEANYFQQNDIAGVNSTLATTNSLRQFYHYAEYAFSLLFQRGDRSEASFQWARDLYQQRKDLIQNSRNETYLLAIYHKIVNESQASHDQLIQILKPLADHPQAALRYLVRVRLYLLNPLAFADFKPDVLKIMNSGSYSTRLLALEALLKGPITPSDELAIIKSVGDQSFSVRSLAIIQVRQFPRRPEHLPAYKSVLSQDDTPTDGRRSLIELLVQWETEESRQLLFESLADSDSTNRRRVRAAFSATRLVGDYYVEALKRLYRNRTDQIRIIATEVASQIDPQDKVLEVVAKQLFEEIDDNNKLVEEAILKFLNDPARVHAVCELAERRQFRRLQCSRTTRRP